MKGALTSTSVKKDGASRWHNALVYMRQHWQLYLFFMLPAVLLTVIFRYIPMGRLCKALHNKPNEKFL